MNVIGIDPGLSGAIAVLNGNEVVGVFDPPVTWIVHGKKKRREYVLGQLMATLTIAKGREAVAAIEQAQPMPRQGVTSTFSIGYGFGLYEMALTALEIPYERVRPQRWKRDVLDGTAKDKGAAYQVAQRLFPAVDLGRRSDHGRAEALLIAEWRRRQG